MIGDNNDNDNDDDDDDDGDDDNDDDDDGWIREEDLLKANGRKTGEHVGVRTLGIRSMQAKIEERVLRRIGHVLRMDNNRPTKQITLGWYAPLITPTPERKPRHGTIEYWRKVLREAGLDADSIEYLVSDKGKWRQIIHERKVHIEEWEKSQAEHHGNQRSQMKRSQASMEKQRSLVCQWPNAAKY